MAEDSMRPHAVARQWPPNDHSGQIRPMATMSALLRKADIPQRRFNVSFGPIADIWLRELPPCSLSGPPDDPTAGEDKNCKCEVQYSGNACDHSVAHLGRTRSPSKPTQLSKPQPEPARERTTQRRRHLLAATTRKHWCERR